MEVTMLITPEWMARRWTDILAAAADVGGWAEVYSQGYIKDAEGDMPHNAPVSVPLYSADNWPSDRDEAILVKSKPYASMRELGDTGAPVPDDVRGMEYPEFMFGTYAIFRIPKDVHAVMNEGYEDTAGTENERFIDDGDHVIVIYMQ